jgi:uncharacterized protein (DUF488 family)
LKIYTIGFAQKSAETFFDLLRQNAVQRLIDIRLNPNGQLSGFAKQEDLPFFLNRLAAGCQYVYLPMLAPTKEILNDYRADANWPHYVARFEELMNARHVPEILDRSGFEALTTCLLCSESTPEQCHRRLVAERFAAQWPGVESCTYENQFDHHRLNADEPGHGLHCWL